MEKNQKQTIYHTYHILASLRRLRGARNNLPTATESMEVLKFHKQCESRQKINSSDGVATSIVDGDNNLLGIIEKGGIYL